MHTEMQDVTIGAPQSTRPSTLVEDDKLWDALTSSRISLPLHKLLPLIPRFRDTLAMLTFDTKSAAPPVNLTELGTGSVRPIGLIRHLHFTLGGHVFTILAVVLRLKARGAYPMLLGRPGCNSQH